jgi:hypothetical protein
MAIQPKCDKCGIEFSEFGAILLGPPDENDRVRKFHLCRACYAEIASSLEPSEPEN